MDDVRRAYPRRHITYVYGGNRDKEVEPILRHLLGVHADFAPVTEVQRLVLTCSTHPNAVPVSELHGHCRKVDTASRVVVEAGGPDCPERPVAGALELASRAAAQGGGGTGGAVVVVCGSLYVAAEARRAVARSEPGLFAKSDTVLS